MIVVKQRTIKEIIHNFENLEVSFINWVNHFLISLTVQMIKSDLVMFSISKLYPGNFYLNVLLFYTIM